MFLLPKTLLTQRHLWPFALRKNKTKSLILGLILFIYHLFLENLTDSECCQVLSLPSSLTIKLKTRFFSHPSLLTLNLSHSSFYPLFLRMFALLTMAEGQAVSFSHQLPVLCSPLPGYFKAQTPSMVPHSQLN